jgi:hypothetical protein
MSWENDCTSAEALLGSSQKPSLDRIIHLIKRVNPTNLNLPDPDSERGYRAKNDLQNLLLENYGEYFHLIPLPYNPKVVLLKHHMLPTIDACHAFLSSLSLKALDAVAEVAATPPGKADQVRNRKKVAPPSPGCCARKIVKRAEHLLDAYEYEEAATLLTRIRISDKEELPALLRAARLLTDEMGAFGRAIETLLSQSCQVIEDKRVRELLALAYFNNVMRPEARALFESLSPGDMGKDALLAYARIAHEDGKNQLALRLLQLAEAREAQGAEAAELRKAIECALQKEAEPDLDRALQAFRHQRFVEANNLARQVLINFPGCRRARELVAELESLGAREKVALLWQQLERAGSPEEKCEILSRLLERDTRRKEEIRGLMENEKAGLKRALADERLRELRESLEHQAWPECFRLLRWFLDQGGEQEQIKEAVGLSPYFAVLYQNRKIARLSSQSAEELWLAYLRATLSVRSGLTAGVLESLEQLRPFFGDYPQFKEEYRALRDSEQQAARRKTDELRGLIGAAHCTREQAEQAFEVLRKTVRILPCQERTRHLALVEEQLERFRPPRSQEGLLEEFRCALFAGNSAKAQKLRGRITDREALDAIDEEIAASFKMEVEPVGVEVCHNLHLDLFREAPPIRCAGITGSQVIFAEGDDAIIVLDLKQMRATRYRSPNFKGLILGDVLPGSGEYLFWEGEGNTRMWRARLSGSEGAFTAVVDVMEKLGLVDGDLEGVFMSETSDVVYVFNIRGKKGERPPRVVKFNIADKSSVVQKYEVAGAEEFFLYRFSSAPERFLVFTGRDFRLINKNLSTIAGNPSESQLFALDVETRELYLVFGSRLYLFDAELRLKKEYRKAIGSAFFEEGQVAGVCPETEMALLYLDQTRGVLFNFVTNEFSDTFCTDNIVCTLTPSSWHYFEYSRDSNGFRIKDVTRELPALLQWRELFVEGEEPEAWDEVMSKLYEENSFAFQPAASAPSLEEPGSTVAPGHQPSDE